ncbi:MAG: PDZ domain-containing protein [Bryobacterales bacterium]|jgi:hypothetical protein|nr:PDZ domain-containing protein [Bryobacterales bacterium]
MLPQDPRKRYLLLLTAASIAILVVGWQIRPVKSADLAASQADISRLQRLTQRNNLENMAAYFTEVAERVKASLVWVQGLEAPGIVWERSDAILAAVPPERAASRASLRGLMELDSPLLTDLYAETPELRMLKAPPELALVPLAITPVGALRQGGWVVLVRRNSPETYEVEATLFSGTRNVRCGPEAVREMLVGLAAENRPLGAAAFDLEGRFFGVVLECDGVRRLISAESLGGPIDRARSIDSQLLFRYGFRPVELDSDRAAYFGLPTVDARPAGLLVQELWRDTLAWDRGIRPGDLCVALDNQPIRALTDLAVMTVPMYRPEYTLTLRRGSQERKVVFPPGAGLSTGDEFTRPAPVTVAAPLPALAVRYVEAGSSAARAGLLSGDRVVSVGPRFAIGRPPAEIFDEQRNDPRFFVVERGHALHGLFFGPSTSP